MVLTLAGATLAAGALGAGASLYGASKSASSAKKTNLLNYLMMKDQQAWEERMSNTAHQREMADLKKAGLNPALTGMGGSGASTPSSGMATAQMPDLSGYGNAGNALITGIANAVNSAQTNQRIANETAKTEAEVGNIIADTAGKIEHNKNIHDIDRATIKNLNASATQSLNSANNISNVSGQVVKSGIEAMAPIGSAIGETIGDAISGGDQTKLTFEQRQQKAKEYLQWKKQREEQILRMNSAKNSKEAWSNIL